MAGSRDQNAWEELSESAAPEAAQLAMGKPEEPESAQPESEEQAEQEEQDSALGSTVTESVAWEPGLWESGERHMESVSPG